MDKLWAIGIMQVWLAIIVYGWLRNKNGYSDQQNYDRLHKSTLTRWMLSSQTRAAFLRQRSHFHKITLPFVAIFYLLAMCGVLFLP